MSDETRLQNTDVLMDRIRSAITAHIKANKTTNSEVIGCLEMVKMDIYSQDDDEEIDDHGD